jgi:hypothetical protein
MRSGSALPRINPSWRESGFRYPPSSPLPAGLFTALVEYPPLPWKPIQNRAADAWVMSGSAYSVFQVQMTE